MQFHIIHTLCVIMIRQYKKLHSLLFIGGYIMKKLFVLGLSCFVLSFAFVSTTAMAKEETSKPYCTGPDCHIMN